MACIDLLLAAQPDILQGAICAFTSVPGFAQIFVGLVIFGIEAAIYLKTDNLMIPSVLGLFISAALATTTLVGMPEPFLAVATIIFAVNMAAIIYGIFKG